MSRFKLKLNETEVLLNSSFHSMKKSSIDYVVSAGIKDFNKAHPKDKLNSGIFSSLVKRITGKIYAHFSRLIADRIMLDWLEANRERWPELFQIRGSLRHVVYAEMIKEAINFETSEEEIECNKASVAEYE